MYYQELIQKFWNLNQKAQLSTTAVAIYLYLLKLANDNNGYDVTVSDVAIGSTLGITRKTVKSARESLRNSGLVQYESKKGYSCSYRIVLNYPLQIPSQEKSQKVIIKHNPLTAIAEKNENFVLDGLPVISTPETTEQKEKASYNSAPEPFKMRKNPSLEEFMAYAHMLSGYEASMASDIKERYALWANNDWCNNLGKPITNWKSSLKNLLPYIKNRTNNGPLSLKSIPSIKPPK
jgi:biotin operon repressor